MFETQVIGNLGKDAVIKEFNGKHYISFTLGFSEKYATSDGVQHERTTWFSCLKLVKSESSKLAQFLKTGTQVYVRGRISAKAYKKDGENEWQAGLNLNVYDLELLSSGKRSDQPAQQKPATQPAPAPTQQGAQFPQNPAPQSQQVQMPADNDLPF